MFGEEKNYENRTNPTFKWCERNATIMDGAVYRHRRKESSREEISSSRNAIYVDVSIRSQEEFSDLLHILNMVWAEHLRLANGGRDAMEVEDEKSLRKE